MEAIRFASLTRNAWKRSLGRCVSFSSASAASNWRASDEAKGETLKRRRVLMKIQKPDVKKWDRQLQNSASFIGSVRAPVDQCETKGGQFGASTMLAVYTDPRKPDSSSPFRIRITMWDDLARICCQHLKPDDLIYVNGWLGCSTVSESTTHYQMNVTELHYVEKHDNEAASDGIGDKKLRSCPTFHKCDESEVKGKSRTEKRSNRLHLWQLYFSNPDEWWDNRTNKASPGAPDFKHKDTDEALWISPNDPPWVSKQLKLQDSAAEHRPKYWDTEPSLADFI